MMRHTYRCFIRTLAPVHLGCDEDYEPMGFVVDETAGSMTVFDPLRFVGSLGPDEKAAFSDLCRRGNLVSILEIYKFLKGRKAPGRTVALCRDFIDHYRQTLALPANEARIRQDLNQFRIERTAFLPYDNRPYIPGTSVKGALRTAYLNAVSRPGIDVKKGDKRGGKKLENILLKSDKIENDPFRLVKVSDFRPMGFVTGRIVYAVNEKKNPAATQEARGPYQILEVIEPGVVFVGDITVEPAPRGAPIQKPVDGDTLWNGARRFYAKEKEREDAELTRVGASPVDGPAEKDHAMLRIGRHSGAESVTIDGYRDIRIMMGRGQNDRFEERATTLWLASEYRKPAHKEGLRPFGWAELGLMTPELASALKSAEEEWVREKEAEQRHIEALRLEREREIEAAKERQAAAEREKEAAAERQAALEAMSPEDRAIAEIQDPGVSENRVVEIYNNLDDMDAARRTDIAAALKAYWQNSGKWKKKACSKKQWVKVQRVKEILGE